jgi:glycosyltransferase involved in cell wall biosynthesis
MSSWQRDLVSVVMPCFNAAPHLAEAVKSALAQTYARVEVIVVDDGSTDDSWAILEQLARANPRVTAISQTNAGPAPARNRGLSAGKGDFIAFLDADDYWDPTCIEKLHRALRQGHADMAYCGWQNIGLPGGRGEPYVPPDYSDVDKAELFLAGNRWPIHAALTRRTVVDEAGGFDDRLTSCMDYDLWLRTAPFVTLVRVPEVLAFYRHHSDSQVTRNRARAALNHWRAQKRFLEAHSEIAARLGKRRVRELTYGMLLQRGYMCYWDRDLGAARTIFRRVIRARYGRFRDWKYMAPALLPLPVHRRLISLFGSDTGARS